MVINLRKLFELSPIKEMYRHKVFEKGVSFGMSEAGYDIRVKQDIHFTRDLFLRSVVERITFNEEGGIEEHTTERGRFVLASTVEEFIMPPNLMGIVHDKSSWARRGLSVFNTVIEPGWKGFLTLELVHQGWRDLHIPAGSGIAQVVFHEVTNPVAYVGRYQNQANRPVDAIPAE